MKVTRYEVQSALWDRSAMRVAVLADLHVCDPWVPLQWIEQIVHQVQAEAPDLILMPGDFLIRGLLGARPVAIGETAKVLSRLSAPMGVFASLGNHDWKDCPDARASGFQKNSVVDALERVGIPVLVNLSVALRNGGWLVGLDSQQAQGSKTRPRPRHDPEVAFRDVPDGASVVVMAHEPDWFVENERRFALQVSGHTHAGQIALGNWRPATPSRYGGRLAYGLHSDRNRHLVVSSGIGFTGLPVRIGAQAEIVMITLAPVEPD